MTTVGQIKNTLQDVGILCQSINCVVIPALLTRFGCKHPQIKAESLHLQDIVIVLFQVHCGGVQSQDDIDMDLTVYQVNQ